MTLDTDKLLRKLPFASLLNREEGLRSVKFAYWFSIAVIFFSGFIRCFLRSVKNDESYYIHAAGVMADCLREGMWFGNEAVGLHGFLFKLPAALLFLLTGNSVFVASLTTVIFAVAAFALCFRLIKRILGSELWALVGAWVMASNYFFIWTAARFLRETPVILALLIFLTLILEKRNKWLIGLGILLVLDAKEYVFFVVIPAFVCWLVLDELGSRNKQSQNKWIFNVFERIIAGILPSVIYLFLMFFTSVIPLNSYLVSLFGLVDGGLGYAVKTFNPFLSAVNEFDSMSQVVLRKQISISELREDVFADVHGFGGLMFVFLRWCCSVFLYGATYFLNVLTIYVGKVLYPSTFSFIGVPKVIGIPALAMSVLQFKSWKKEGKLTLLILPILFWVYLSLFILRVSNGRYLIPLLPVMSLFFVLFVRHGIKQKRFVLWTLFVVTAAVVAGFAFDHKSVLLKACLNISIVSALLFAVRCANRKRWYLEYVSFVISAQIILFCIMVAWASCLTIRGQVGNSLVFGYNMECKRVVGNFSESDQVWVNSLQWSQLIQFHRGDRLSSPEWHWRMISCLPKKRMLHRYDNQKTHNFNWVDMDDFEARVEALGIEKVGLVVSLVERFPFSKQEKLDELMDAPWLTLEDVVPLRNKTLYKFAVVGQVEASRE